MRTAWDKAALDAAPVRGRGLRPGDAGWDAYRGDVVLDGAPDLVARPESEAEIADLLAYADDRRVPVTFAGGQTSLTGSSVALDGVLVATERMARILDLRRDPETGGMVAEAEPGIFLGDFQREVEREGWFYPPDPTSRNEARLGATVATNATGEDTLLYGPTRKWIRELGIVTANGKTRTLRRSKDSHPNEEKATAGYYHWGDEIDLVIGSEGTLAAVTRVVVDLIPRPSSVFGGMAFFPSVLAALRFVVAARDADGVRPRALELLDRASLDLVGQNPEGIRWPEATGAAVYFKQDCGDDAACDGLLEAWLALLEEHLTAAGAVDLLDHVVVAADAPGQRRLREFRHRVPATLHETVARYREAGGGKVGTDWWVPYRMLPDFLEGWRRRIREAGLDHLAFGHAGNGHPHVNFLPKDRLEMQRARGLVLDMCREAVALGGGVAGEHGLGKLKRDLLALQYPGDGLTTMRGIKRRWDPHWVLGPGNVILPEDA